MSYLLTFTMSIFLYAEANKTIDRKIKKILWFFSLIVPILLAAFRGLNVGTDIRIYVEPSYRDAIVSSSFSAFAKYRVTEPLFNILVYISAKGFHSMQVLLGTIQLLISLPIYVVIEQRVEKNRKVMVLFAYYFIFYGSGLNIMRQSISMSLGMLAFSYAVDKKKMPVIVCLLLAVGFHKSAIFMLFLIFAYLIIDKFKLNWIPYVCAFVIIIGTIGYEQIMRAVISLFPQYLGKYLEYFSDAWKINDWPVTDLILYILIFLIGINLLQDKDGVKRFCGLMSICSLAGIWISKTMTAVGRIMMYCNFFSIFDFSYVKARIKGDKDNQFILNIILVAILVTYWFVQYIYLKNNAIYPYEFVKLG